MVSKITNFVLAETIIKDLCRKKGFSFVDVDICFYDEDDKNINGDIYRGIAIKQSRSIVHTIYQIISQYIEKSKLILGHNIFDNHKEKIDFLLYLTSFLRGIFYSTDTLEIFDEDDLFMQRLYQKPLIWILMKDIICPIYNVELKNTKLICGSLTNVDISTYYERDDEEESFIWVNEIQNRCVQNAFIFVEALRSYKLNPIEVIKEIFETELYDKFIGLLTVALDDENSVNQFIQFLIYITGVNLYDFRPKFASGSIKEAQMMSTMGNSQWWFMGLLETMLGGVRGSDWSTSKVLDSEVEKFWNKVEKIKHKRGGNYLPYDSLLALKNHESGAREIDPSKTLQQLLSSDRVW